jgi:excisionase family DNA binding protein
MAKTLSTAEAAKLCNMGIRSFASWIDQGLLKAGKTPGGHRRIEVEDLVDFLRHQGLTVPPPLIESAPKVLVVDDEEGVSLWIKEAIKEVHPDYEVQQAHDGFSAGDLVGSWHPNVVILDLRMPGMDGFDVCRRIKSKAGTVNIVVIAMTAYYSPEAEREILECGARICLTKPLEAAALVNELESALQAWGLRTGAPPVNRERVSDLLGSSRSACPA